MTRLKFLLILIGSALAFSFRSRNKRCRQWFVDEGFCVADDIIPMYGPNVSAVWWSQEYLLWGAEFKNQDYELAMGVMKELNFKLPLMEKQIKFDGADFDSCETLEIDHGFKTFTPPWWV